MATRIPTLTFLTLTVVVLGDARPVAAQWGTLKGRVTVEGDVPAVPLLHAKGDVQVKEAICRAHDIADDSLVVDAEMKGIANVFVFLQRAPDRIHPDLAAGLEDVVFDQRQCRFEPHALVVQTGQTILVKSDDPVAHNWHISPTFNEPQNLLIPPKKREGVSYSFRQREPSPVQVKCDLHPWMTAWWLVVDHPYAAVTDEEGAFVIENLPAGEHTFRVWQERAGWIDKKLTVEVRDGETTEVPIEVSGAELSKS